MLRAAFVESAKDVEKVLGRDRPLETLSARIYLANSLGLLGPDMRHDLSLIHKIRNEFAHQHAPASFDSEPNASRCRDLRLAELLPLDWPSRSGPRSRFIFTVVILANQLMLRGLSLKHAEPGKDFRFERGS